jgi:cellulose synthase/poly-beta-1,6-N-acetylglucosamine synthase-like glycosyltransferase
MLQLTYSHFEIIVINDGSTDRTLERLKEAFDLQLFPEVVRRRLTSQPIRGVYRSSTYPELKVVDKRTARVRPTRSTQASMSRSIRSSARWTRMGYCVLTVSRALRGRSSTTLAPLPLAASSGSPTAARS